MARRDGWTGRSRSFIRDPQKQDQSRSEELMRVVIDWLDG
jgi:hypothetical protein